MAVLPNTITTAQVCEALSQEMTENFTGEYDRLAELLGLLDVQTVSAGTALYQAKASGKASETVPAEGDESPLSQYEVKKTPIDPIEPARYAKLTTAESILKGGIEVAVTKTDKKFAQNLRAKVLDKFFSDLANGSGKATGETLQAVLAKADAVLGDAMEDNGDEGGAFIHWVNRQDIAEYLANATVTTQTAFGLDYIKDFLGVSTIIQTNKVPKGTVYVTPADNIHVYGIDFDALASAGLKYVTDDYGLIGVAHEPVYNRGSVETHAMLGARFVPERTDYIVKATIKAGTASTGA